MKRAGHEGTVPQRAALGIAMDDGIHERTGLAAGERLDRHPGRLVEGEQGRILERDAERTCDRRDEVVRRFQELADDNRLAAAELQSLRHVAVSDQNVPRRNGLFDERARRAGENMKNGGVQPNAALSYLNFSVNKQTDSP